MTQFKRWLTGVMKFHKYRYEILIAHCVLTLLRIPIETMVDPSFNMRTAYDGVGKLTLVYI